MELQQLHRHGGSLREFTKKGDLHDFIVKTLTDFAEPKEDQVKAWLEQLARIQQELLLAQRWQVINENVGDLEESEKARRNKSRVQNVIFGSFGVLAPEGPWPFFEAQQFVDNLSSLPKGCSVFLISLLQYCRL